MTETMICDKRLELHGFKATKLIEVKNGEKNNDTARNDPKFLTLSLLIVLGLSYCFFFLKVL